MTPDRDARARTLVRAGLAALLAQAVLHAPSEANGGVRIAGSVAHTFAILGEVREGGPAFSLNALVPADGASGRFDLGVGAWASDMGTETERLYDPVTDADLGLIGGASCFLVGGGLAGDFHLFPGPAQGVRDGPFVTGTAGIYYVESRENGSLEHTDNALGWSLGAAWRLRLGAIGSLGPSVQYHRVFDDRVGRFMMAGVDWTWR